VRTLLTAGLFAVALLAAACGGGDKTALPTVVTTTTAVPVTAPPLPALHFDSSEEAIRHLFLQWTAGDRQAAGQAASADAVNALFAKPPGENKFRGCSHPADKAQGSDCTYQYKQGLLQMHVAFANNSWQITKVEYQGV
jgi:hypothetical protein